MKYITRLATIQQVKLMTEALKKSFSKSPNVTLEIDWKDKKAIRIHTPKLERPLFMALCKGGDTWMTSYPDDLFI
jgi:hypothetical protein